jgi:hypothetical protein
VELKYFLYFLIGGFLTSAVTYLANHSKSLVAAFVATLPLITTSTLLLIYVNGGTNAALAYTKGLIIMIIPWMFFMLSIVFLTPRIHFIYSLITGVCLQIIIAFWILLKWGAGGPR